MNSFEAMGQAHLDAAEGHRQFSHALARWVSQVAKRWFGGAIRSNDRAMPW